MSLINISVDFVDIENSNVSKVFVYLNFIRVLKYDREAYKHKKLNILFKICVERASTKLKRVNGLFLIERQNETFWWSFNKRKRSIHFNFEYEWFFLNIKDAFLAIKIYIKECMGNVEFEFVLYSALCEVERHIFKFESSFIVELFDE